MPANAARDTTTEAIAWALLSVARSMNQVKAHDWLCKQAGVDLDRGGAALLYKLYSEGDDVRPTDLAERLGIDSPAVTRKVQQLERAGLLRRSPDPEDARALRLRLTDTGRSSIERLFRAREERLEELLAKWSRCDLEDFARLLQLFASTLAGEGEEHDAS
jgi:DNA-binding MarR family transcriptional regulator